MPVGFLRLPLGGGRRLSARSDRENRPASRDSIPGSRPSESIQEAEIFPFSRSSLVAMRAIIARNRWRSSNRIEIPASKLNLDNSGISINGVDIIPPGGQSSFTAADGLADAINARQASTGVTASVAADGSLALYSSSGADISLNHIASRNDAFNITLGTYHGSLSLSSASEVRVGMGIGGTVAGLC